MTDDPLIDALARLHPRLDHLMCETLVKAYRNGTLEDPQSLSDFERRRATQVSARSALLNCRYAVRGSHDCPTSRPI